MRRFVFILSLFLSPLFLFAQTDSLSAEKALTKSLLWKIEAPDIETPSYLYGTIHLIPADDFFLTPETMSIMDSVQRVTFEIDIEKLMSPAGLMQQIGLLFSAFMDNGTTLKDLLSPEDYAIVNDHFTKTLGMPLTFLERIKPLFLSAMVSQDTEGGGMPGGMGQNSGTKSYELEILQLAKERNQEIDELETAEFQMSLFDSIPYQVQAEMLVDAIEAEGTSGEGSFDQMVELYKAQDIETMHSLSLGEGEMNEDMAYFEELLIVKRNQNWIPVIHRMMGEKPTLFAVGAGHLGGPKGVIRLLEAEGFTLTPLH
ncbi:MAG: TraB/GumN family protein [Bacteroidota bacterium]